MTSWVQRIHNNVFIHHWNIAATVYLCFLRQHPTPIAILVFLLPFRILRSFPPSSCKIILLIYFVYQRSLKSENTKKSKKEKCRIFATDIIWKRKNIGTVTNFKSKERKKNYTEMKRKGRKEIEKKLNWNEEKLY